MFYVYFYTVFILQSHFLDFGQKRLFSVQKHDKNTYFCTKNVILH